MEITMYLTIAGRFSSSGWMNIDTIKYLTACICLYACLSAIAEVTPGQPNTILTIVDSSTPGQYSISGGTTSENGANLFHGFDLFSLDQGEIALYQGEGANVVNIINRITGPSVSTINGTIDTVTNYTNANVFFFNPNGVIFDEDSSVSVGGSFYVSSGSYLKFDDGSIYGLGETSTPLSIASPTAFGFVEDTSGEISFSGILTLHSGDLTVLATDITVDGAEIEMSDGNIYMSTRVNQMHEASVTPNQTINNQGSDSESGTITIKNDSFINAQAGSNETGGQIVIEAQQIILGQL